MPLESKIYVLGNWLFNKFNLPANKTALGLHTDGVFYGDQLRVPVTPALCVETGEVEREGNYIGSGGMRKVDVNMDINLLVYHSKVTDTETNRRDLDQMLDRIEDFIHADMHMEDQVLWSLCTRIEPGYLTRDGSTMRAGRIVITIRSQEMLPC